MNLKRIFNALIIIFHVVTDYPHSYCARIFALKTGITNNFCFKTNNI